MFATVFELCKVSWEKREEKCFSHTRTHERTCTLVAARKEKQQNIFFVLLFIYILEDLKLIVFIFTLTFDKPDIFSLLLLSSFS